VGSAPPDRSNRVDDMSGRQAMTGGQPRLPRRTASYSTTFGKKLGPCSLMDRAVDTTAAEKRGVSRVDDRVDPQAGYVAGGHANACRNMVGVGHGPTEGIGRRTPYVI